MVVAEGDTQVRLHLLFHCIPLVDEDIGYTWRSPEKEKVLIPSPYSLPRLEHSDAERIAREKWDGEEDSPE